MSKRNIANLIINNLLISTSSVNVTIIEPILNMTMGINDTNIQGSNNLTISINVTNAGNANAYNVAVNYNLTDLINNYVNGTTIHNVTITIDGIDYTINQLDVTINLGTIMPNSTKHILINFTVNDNVIIGSNYVGNVTISCSSTINNTIQTRYYTSNTSLMFTTELPQIDKTVYISSYTNSTINASVGDDVIYLINITLPKGNYYNITVTDELPKGFTFVSAVIGENTITPIHEEGRLVTFELLNIKSADYDGNILLYLTSRVIDDESIDKVGDTKINKVTLTNNGIFINNSSSTITIIEPSISMNMSFNESSVEGGKNISLDIDVSNAGNANAYNVTIKDNLTSLINNYVNGSTIDDITITVGDEIANCTWDELIASINLGTIAPHATKHVKLQFIVKDDVIIGTLYRGNATVLAYSVPILSKDTRLYVGENSTEFITDEPSISKTVSKDNVVIGESVKYYINVILPKGNYTNITIIDELQIGLLMKNATVNGNSIPFDVSNDGNKVTFQFLNLSSYDYDNNLVIEVINIVANISSNVDGVVLTNNATLISHNVTINNDTASVTIVEPVISISKVSQVKEAQVNREITFEFTIKNTGTANGTGVYITDDLSQLINEKDLDNVRIIYNGESYDYTRDGKKYKIHVGNLGIGESKTFLMTFILDKDAEIYKNYTNVAVVTGYSNDDYSNRRSYKDTSNDSFVVDITSMPNISIDHDEGSGKSSPMTVSNPLGVVVDDNFDYRIYFDNKGVINGYNAVIDLILPDSVSNFSTTYLGSKVNIKKGTDLGNGTWYDPGNKAYIDVPKGSNLFILEVPVGGFTTNAPAAEIIIKSILNKNVNTTDLINITAIPFFQYGNDYTGVENPIRGNSTSAFVKPLFASINKYSSLNGVLDGSGEVATGYSWRFSFVVTVDLVDDVEYTTFVLNDTLPGNLKFLDGTLNVYDSGGNIVSPDSYEVFYPSTTGGSIIVRFLNKVTGTSNVIDYKFNYTVYAPEFDNSTDSLKRIISDVYGGLNTTVNKVTIDYGIANYGINDSINDSYIVYLESLKITKGVKDNENGDGQGGFTGPGHILTYSLNYEISDYFNFTQFYLNDTVGGAKGFDQSFTGSNLIFVTNGNQYVMNSSYYSIYNITSGESVGKWGILINISKFFNDNFGSSLIRNGTSGSVKFNVTVRPYNQNGTIIESMYTISNNVVGNATLPNGNHVTETGSSYIYVDAPRASNKTIKYINEHDAQIQYNSDVGGFDIYTEDNVTFLIEADVPNSLNQLKIVDHVTIPIFTVEGFNVINSTIGEIPKAGHWTYADESSLLYDMDGNVINPEVLVDSSKNTITFNFNGIYKEVQNRTTLRLYITLAVNRYYLADGLFKPNLISIYYNDQQLNAYAKQQAVWMLLNEPVLNINKTVNDTIIENGDTVTYNITVSNTGHANAYNVTIYDDFLEKYDYFIVNGTVSNFQVIWGNGTEIPITMDFFNSKKGYNFGTVFFDSENNCNNFTIYYTVTFNSHSIPSHNVINTVEVLRYTSIVNGSNFIDDMPLFSNAILETYMLNFTKEYMGSNDFNTSDGRKQESFIGESVIFNLTAKLPKLDVVNLTFEDFAMNLGFYKFEVMYSEGINHDDIVVIPYIFHHENGDIVRIAFKGTMLASNVDDFVTVLLYYVVNETYYDNKYVFNQSNAANLYYNYPLIYSEIDDLLNNTLKNHVIETTVLYANNTYTVVQSNLTLTNNVNVTSVQPVML